MIDFDSHTDSKLNFCSNCSATGPSVFFVSSSITRENLTNESTRALDVWIFFNMKPIDRRLYLLHCPNENKKFFRKCLFNIVSGHIARAASVSKKKLERHRRLIEILCNKKVGLMRKRQLLSGSHGLKLLTLIQPSISRHLEKRHAIEQKNKRIRL